MSRTAARVTQADIARAIRAIKQAGGGLAVEIARDGTIRIVPHETTKRASRADNFDWTPPPAEAPPKRKMNL